jgi:hypothetical protein
MSETTPKRSHLLSITIEITNNNLYLDEFFKLYNFELSCNEPERIVKENNTPCFYLEFVGMVSWENFKGYTSEMIKQKYSKKLDYSQIKLNFI